MNKFVVKVGGSLLYNQDMRINELFLGKLKDWFDTYSKDFEKLAIVVGGGKLSRQVGNTLKGIVSGDSSHNVAMQITQVNAEIVKGYLNSKEAYVPQLLTQAIDELKREGRRLVISGGLKEGWSTDMDSAVFADALGLKEVYKLSNIDHVYTSDPNVDKNAKPIKQLTWDEYFEMFNISVNSTHSANLSLPISVETAIFCKNKGITFYVSGGSTIYSSNSLSEVFKSGTCIKP